MGKVVNISYLLILNYGGMKNSCEQWEEIPFVHKTWEALNNHFVRAYRFYHIQNKSIATAHGYGAAANHVHGEYSKTMI